MVLGWQRTGPAPFVPTMVKKKEEVQDVEKPSRDADPEKEIEEEDDLYKSSADTEPEKKSKESGVD